MIRKILLLVCMLAVKAHAQNFKSFNTTNGLSDNTIKCMQQDKHGFLWIGGFNGLSRYDGNTFRNFYQSLSKRTLSNNHIEALCDRGQFLLIGTSTGINRLDYRAGTITRCLSQGKEIKGTIRQFVGFDKVIYAMRSDGSLFYSRDLSTFYRSSLDNKSVKAITKYNNHVLAVNTTSNVLLYDIVRKRIISRISVPSSGMIGSSHLLYYSHNAKKIYLGFGIGAKGLAINVDPHYRMSIDAEDVPTNLKCVADWMGSVVFGTDGSGLIIRNNHQTHTFLPSNSNISSDAIHSLLVDRQNNLWIGTYRGGLNVYSPRYNVSVSAFTYCHKKAEQGILAQLCYSFVEGCQRSGNRFL